MSVKYELFTLQMRMLKSYQDSVEDIEREIDDIVYQYCGVKAIQYDKEHFSHNDNISTEILEKMMEALKEPQRQLDYTIYAINQLKPIVEGNLSKLPEETQKACKLIFWEKYTFEKAGKLLGYSDHGLWDKVRREIGKI